MQIKEYEKLHKNNCLKDWGNLIEHLYFSCNVLAELISNTYLDKVISSTERFIVVLSIRVLKTSKCVFDLALKGYYTEAGSLLRDIYERRLLLNYVIKFKDSPDIESQTEKWFKSPNQNYDEIFEIRRSGIAKRLYGDSDSKFFKFHCNLTHPNVTSCIFSDMDIKKLTPKIFPAYNKENYSLIISTAFSELYNVILNYHNLFKNKINESNRFQSELEKIGLFREELKKFIDKDFIPD